MDRVKERDLGLTVYDNFASNSIFSAAIIAETDPIQYWRSRPLFMKKAKPLLSDAISYTQDPSDCIENPNIKPFLDKVNNYTSLIDDYIKRAEEISKNIMDVSYISKDEEIDDVCPSVINPQYETIDIKDDQGNIIKTIVIDIHERNKKIDDFNEENDPNKEVPITILEMIPPEWSDDSAPQKLDEITICTLPESFIKKKLVVANEIIPNLLNDINSETSIIIDEYRKITELIPDQIDDYNPKEEIDEIIADMQNPIDIWYGIPLINLSPKEIPLEDSLILHINPKKDWTLDITNVVGTSPDKFQFNIPKQIPPETRFMAGVIVDNNRVQIFLKVDGDPILYTSAIELPGNQTFFLNSFGGDNEAKKSLGGNLYDIFYWAYPVPIDSIDLKLKGTTTELPYYPESSEDGGKPSDGIQREIYDFNTQRILGKKIYTIKNKPDPTYNNGEWFNLIYDDEINLTPEENGRYLREPISNNRPPTVEPTINKTPWKFAMNSYLDRIFCRKNLLNSNFTITWYQYQPGFEVGIRTFLSDNIHNNYIRYNYDTFELLIDFNNFHYRERITLPEFNWCQFTIRFNNDTNNLIISFIDFANSNYEEIVINVGEGTEFELVSLWGRFVNDTGRYQEIQTGIFGFLIIHKNFIETDTLKMWYNNHRSFFGHCNPRPYLNDYFK